MRTATAQGLARSVCMTMVGLLVVSCIWFGLSLDYAFATELWWIQASGYSALGALFLSLSVTPFFVVWNRVVAEPQSSVIWIAFRRSFGMTAAWLGMLHAAVVLVTYLHESWSLILTAPYLRAGFVAVLILLALLLTSYPRLSRLLHIRFWKQLHRLSYIVAVLLFQHLLQAPFAPRWLTLVLFTCLLLVGSLRLLPFKVQRLS